MNPDATDPPRRRLATRKSEQYEERCPELEAGDQQWVKLGRLRRTGLGSKHPARFPAVHRTHPATSSRELSLGLLQMSYVIAQDSNCRNG